MSNSTVTHELPKNVEIQFYKRDGLDVARYVSETTVREEVLDHGRLSGFYWSAVGEVLREVGPGRTKHVWTLDPILYPIQVFELELDGQSLFTHCQWLNSDLPSSSSSKTPIGYRIGSRVQTCLVRPGPTSRSKIGRAHV